jgi:hypothetical protein
VGVPVCDTEASTSKGNLAASRGLFFLLGFKGGPGVLVASRGLASGLFEGLLALGSYMGVLILSLLTVVSQEDVGLRSATLSGIHGRHCLKTCIRYREPPP